VTRLRKLMLDVRLATDFGPVRQFNLAHPQDDGLGRFFKPVLYVTAIAKAVGMWEGCCFCGLSKAGGKGGKPGFGFPPFPWAGISIAHLISGGCFSPFLRLSMVRRKRYDSVPVSKM
jgi:hypothetical protein